MKSKTTLPNGSTQYLGVDTKIDFDILLWRQMERIHATEDLSKKVTEVDDLHNMLIVWSEKDKDYLADIKPTLAIWEKAHMDGPIFDLFKKKYIYCKYQALMKLMHRLSIIGELSVIPPREEMTRL